MGGDDEDRQKLNTTLFAVAKESVALLREYVGELEEARKKVGLADANPVQLQTAKDFLDLDMDGDKTQEEMQRIVIALAKTTMIIPSLWQDVLEAESEGLFGGSAQGTKLLGS